MFVETTLEISGHLARARRSYELGRLRSSAWRALLLAVPIAFIALFTSGRSALMLLPLAILAWTFAHWRGGEFLRGSVFGLLGGVVTLLLPMSILRPCCAPGAMPNIGTACCTMPGLCLAAGGAVGIFLAAAVPFGKASWSRTAAGMILGIASIAVVKCATLLAGEAVGLLGGLAAGILAASLAKSILRARSAQ
ncbi:MAG: hypothetical protein ABI183_20830 [Polyangiaceae bacterium]